MNYDLDKFGLSEEELFSPVDNSSLESEKITARTRSCLPPSTTTSWNPNGSPPPGIPTGIPCSAYFLRKKSTLPYFASWV